MRKNFTPSEMVAIKRAMEPEVSIGQGKRTDLTSSDSDKVQHRTDEIIASYCDTSRDTLRKAEKIVEAAEQQPKKSFDVPDVVELQIIWVLHFCIYAILQHSTYCRNINVYFFSNFLIGVAL